MIPQQTETLEMSRQDAATTDDPDPGQCRAWHITNPFRRAGKSQPINGATVGRDLS